MPTPDVAAPSLPARAAIAALEACSLDDLYLIERHHLPRIKRPKVMCTAAAAAAQFAHEVARAFPEEGEPLRMPHLRIVGDREVMAGVLTLPASLPLFDPLNGSYVSDPIPFEIAPPESIDMLAVYDGNLYPEADPDQDDDQDDPDATVLEPSAQALAEAQAWFASERAKARD